MRVIAGKAKGRPVLFPAKSKDRPTADRIKEALFNILSPLDGKIFLDICAGSGNIGIEALSRGAIHAAFIEKESILVEHIRRNLAHCGFTGQYEILAMDMKRAILQLQKKEAHFDVIFADPPYETGLVHEICQALAKGKLFTKEGILVIQHSVREEPEWQREERFQLVDQRKYGDTRLTFLKCRERDEDL